MDVFHSKGGVISYFRMKTAGYSRRSLQKNFFMNPTVFRYGIYAALTILVLGAVNLFIIAKKADYGVQEIAGYLTIVIAMIFVFFGIRYFRDKVNGGSLGFGEGLKVGVLIVLIPAVLFGLFDILYTEVINPTWKEDYYNHFIDETKKTVAPEKLDAELKKLEKQKELFSSPVMQFILMTGTVFIIGLMVAIISALTLRRAKTVSA